jgi:hypothetical protein
MVRTSTWSARDDLTTEAIGALQQKAQAVAVDDAGDEEDAVDLEEPMGRPHLEGVDLFARALPRSRGKELDVAGDEDDEGDGFEDDEDGELDEGDGEAISASGRHGLTGSRWPRTRMREL